MRPPKGQPTRLRHALFAALALLVFVQCEDDACEAGDLCTCRGGDECYLECDGGGCDQECNALERCGNLCGDGCTFTCSSTNECSSYCDDDCATECHDTESCGMLCGADCLYDCHNANRCGARVGPNSVVRCTDVSSCVVECDGSCRVLCTRVGGPGCAIMCRDGGPVPCADGTPGCQECPG